MTTATATRTMLMETETCACERQHDESVRVLCYINHYSAFIKARYPNSVDGCRTKLGSLTDAYQQGTLKSLRDLKHDVILCTSLTHEMAESIILRAFQQKYAKRHPGYVRDVQASGFKSQTELFFHI